VDTALEVLGFLIGVSAGLFLVVSLLVTLPPWSAAAGGYGYA
jgi:hypothetical protein